MLEKFQIKKRYFWLYLLIGISVILGVAFRFFYLENKVFWADETCTLLRISGYFETDFLKQFSFDQIIGANSLQQYQIPNTETGIVGTIKGLSVEEPQLSPFYFVVLYQWIQSFGNSIVAIRSLSAIATLLLLPALYWFCLELFQTSLAVWVAIGLAAVSPLQIGFAHEARPYAFWLITFVLANAALLRALRINSFRSWIVYTLSIPLNIYTYLLTGLLFFAHTIYVFWHGRFRVSQLTRNYLISLLAGMLLSAGWLLVVIYNLISIPQLKGSHESINLIGIIKRIALGGIRNIFFDLNNEKIPDVQVFGFDPAPLISVVIVTLFIYFSYIFWKYAPRNSSVFMAVLIITSLLPLILSGRYLPRYLITTYLLVQLIISYGLSNRISFIIQQRQKVLWKLALAAFFSLSIFACIISVQKDTSWIKHGYRDAEIARFINQSPNPLVVSDTSTCVLLMLTNYLDSKVKLQVEPSCGICTGEAATFERPDKLPNLPSNFSDVFLYSPSQKLLDGLSKRHTIELIQNPNFGNSQLYRVKSM